MNELFCPSCDVKYKYGSRTNFCKTCGLELIEWEANHCLNSACKSQQESRLFDEDAFYCTECGKLTTRGKENDKRQAAINALL